jgi:hypothetical protein
MYTTGLHYLDVGLAALFLVGMFWWVYRLTSLASSRRAQPVPVKAAAQPWGVDKAGGRGNR